MSIHHKHSKKKKQNLLSKLTLKKMPEEIINSGTNSELEKMSFVRIHRQIQGTNQNNRRYL